MTVRIDREGRGPLRFGAVAVCLGMLAACSVTPEPVEGDAKLAVVAADRQRIELNQERITAPLGLYDALARVVLYNLDNRSRMMEEALANRQLDLLNYDMLPTLAYDAGFAIRDSDVSSVEADATTHVRGTNPTYSADRDRVTQSLKFSWNILDFGVSYLQAKQQADRYLIAQANREKLMLRLLQQARTAYWRAAAAQRLQPQVARVLGEAKGALAEVDRAAAERLRPQLSSLQIRRSLIEIIGQLEALDRQLGASLLDIKSLMSLPPTAELELEMPERLPAMPGILRPMEDLEIVALANSGDIAEQIYTLRVEQAEGKKALLRLLPGIEMNASYNYDANSFLMNNTWHEAGSRVTWNLFRLFSLGAALDTADARQNLAETRRLAMTMAVISRLHMSWWRYADMLSQYNRAEEINAIEGQITVLSKGAEAAQAGTAVERVRNEASALRALLKYYEAFSNVQDALGAMLVSLGLNPVPMTEPVSSVSELSKILRARMAPWEEGSFPGPDTLAAPAKAGAPGPRV